MSSNRFSKVASLAALGLLSLVPAAADAALGDAYSYSRDIGGEPFSGFTTVAKRKLPPGTYVLQSTGVIRNDSATQVAYVSCEFDTPAVQLYYNYSSFVVPVQLSPGVSGSATWSLLTTVVIPPGDGVRVAVVCGSFGPAPDSDLEAWFPNLVAIKVGQDIHTTAP